MATTITHPGPDDVMVIITGRVTHIEGGEDDVRNHITRQVYKVPVRYIFLAPPVVVIEDFRNRDFTVGREYTFHCVNLPMSQPTYCGARLYLLEPEQED